MEFTFYIEEFLQLGQLPFAEMLYRIFFWYFGWMPVAIAFLFGISQLWLDHVSGKWASTQKFIFLAVDVPRNNEQSPKAVENLFTYLMGTQSGPNLMETWWEGKFQLGFSFEIVGIDGYIQFVVRTPAAFRYNIESAIYAQYPDAEVTEVADYTEGAPTSFPDPEYDIWGAEYVYTGNEFLPIKTYPQFEYKFGEPETHFKDPLALLMDLMSSFKPGEQLWFQVVLVPIDNSWTKRADEFIKSVIGAKPEQIMSLPPIKKRQLEAASEKKNKVAFKAKIRAVYFSRKDVMDKAKVVNGFNGYMRQYAENNLNGFMPYKGTVTSTAYFRAASRLAERKNNIMAAYRGRSAGKGSNPYVMGVEELATIWHFPIDAVVKAPLLQRAGAKRIEAPMGIPTGDVTITKNIEPIFDQNYRLPEEPIATKAAVASKPSGDFGSFLERQLEKQEHQEAAAEDAAPSNLPFV